MPDNYDNIIKFYPIREAALFLAQLCREKDRQIERAMEMLRDDTRRLSEEARKMIDDFNTQWKCYERILEDFQKKRER